MADAAPPAGGAAEAGGAPAQGGGGQVAAAGGGRGAGSDTENGKGENGPAKNGEKKLNEKDGLRESVNQMHPRITKSVFDAHISGDATPLSRPLSRHSMDLDDYFAGPRDLDGHSKLPIFMRMHGSIMPRMIVPLLCVGGWATAVTVISELVYPLEVSTVLLTVLGFVVGLSLSFRSSTAYERYSEGRKTFCTLMIHCRNLTRIYWISVAERPDKSRDDLLQKVTAINLVLSFAIAVKHRLRFEPYAHYDDIAGLISHLDTYAKAAHVPSNLEVRKKTPWKRLGEKLGLPFAMSNPRKDMKRSDRPLGNLPMEILGYLASYVQEVSSNGQLPSTVVQSQVFNALAGMTDTAGNLERVLTTPLPIGYNILISQIVLLYIYLLPFQLVGQLNWIAIPATLAASYIILGIALIGDELENPFGNDVNDLPLDQYCNELQREIDTLMSTPAAGAFNEAVELGRQDNKPLWPLSERPYSEWAMKSEDEIRSALRTKVVVAKGVGSARNGVERNIGLSKNGTAQV